MLLMCGPEAVACFACPKVHVCISARFARAATFCFHLNLALSMASKKRNYQKEIRYDFSNCCYNRLYIVAMVLVLNYGPQNFLKSRYGPSLQKAERPWHWSSLRCKVCANVLK